ncbi:hypothetical protein GQ600_4553 [Phytophthora cactorum]|nr:hypothetical protein GQ600_4553 [Phytophthora cactorum]
MPIKRAQIAHLLEEYHSSSAASHLVLLDRRRSHHGCRARGKVLLESRQHKAAHRCHHNKLHRGGRVDDISARPKFAQDEPGLAAQEVVRDEANERAQRELAQRMSRCGDAMLMNQLGRHLVAVCVQHAAQGIEFARKEARDDAAAEAARHQEHEDGAQRVVS